MAPELRFVGAGDRTRTGDPHLGKVMLYQLSHARAFVQSTGFPSPLEVGQEAD
jgi:hypothetical protein